MADQQQQQQQAMLAPFPAPPPFYQHFTKRNIAKLRQLRKEAGISGEKRDGDDGRTRNVDVLSLPSELRYLIPPEPPADGKYKSFGVEIDRKDVEATLQEAGIDQLFPSHASVRLNPQAHLITLARSLLTSFLALTGILSQNPELYQEKTRDMQTIVYNMHYLINHYRPHQARETLILMMEEHIETMRNDIRAIREGKRKVERLMDTLQESGSAQEIQKTEDATKQEVDEEQAAKKTRERQRAAWASLDTDDFKVLDHGAEDCET